MRIADGEQGARHEFWIKRELPFGAREMVAKTVLISGKSLVGRDTACGGRGFLGGFLSRQKRKILIRWGEG